MEVGIDESNALNKQKFDSWQLSPPTDWITDQLLGGYWPGAYWPEVIKANVHPKNTNVKSAFIKEIENV